MDASSAPTTEALLLALQHGDSFFPGGGIAFSWGLEALREDGFIGRAGEVEGFVRGQLRYRWAVCDRAVLNAAYRAGPDIVSLAGLDRFMEAMTLAPELRDGSRRAGASLLSVHERLDTPGAAAYRAAIRTGAALGHLPVVQGLAWRGAGLEVAHCEAVAAHMLCVGMIGAALRMGVLGHLEGQRILTDLRQELSEMLAEPAPSLEAIFMCTPMTDVASMRHEAQPSRLFAN